ncbi:MAG: hypothetical protein HY909_30565 [Deltaproteobacteria bacterium]|nr:hypothetical protein [Deltaproteobacteria bacterium]
MKKFLEYFVKVEPGPEGPSLSDDELRKILAEEEAEGPKGPKGSAPTRAPGAAGAPGAPGVGGAPKGQPSPARPAPRTAPGAAPGPFPGGQRVVDVAAPAVFQLKPAGASLGPNSELPDFPTIYRAAKVPAPAHGYDVDKLVAMLANPRLAEMPMGVRANSVLMALEVAGVPIQDVIADAVAKDHALDDFEAWWAAKVNQLEADKRAENTAIEEELNRHLEAQRERIRANNQAVQVALEGFQQWKEQKRAEEQRLYATVAPFVTENLVTLNTGTIPAATPTKR